MSKFIVCYANTVLALAPVFNSVEEAAEWIGRRSSDLGTQLSLYVIRELGRTFKVEEVTKPCFEATEIK